MCRPVVRIAPVRTIAAAGPFADLRRGLVVHDEDRRRSGGSRNVVRPGGDCDDQCAVAVRGGVVDHREGNRFFGLANGEFDGGGERREVRRVARVGKVHRNRLPAVGGTARQSDGLRLRFAFEDALRRRDGDQRGAEGEDVAPDGFAAVDRRREDDVARLARGAGECVREVSGLLSLRVEIPQKSL